MRMLRIRSVPRSALAAVLLVVAMGGAGCGGASDRPELGEVTGNVKLDGKPLAGVIILFKPDTGRAATATTDSEGNYELIYRYGVSGAKVGPNTVSFEWPLGEAGVPIPQKYSAGRSTEKVDVQPGENEFNFDLQSK